MSANGAAWLATPGRIHHELWAHAIYARFEPRDSLFPGLMATLLAVTFLVVARAPLRDPRVRTAIGIGVAGVLLAFGPATPLYHVFHASVPFASGVRAASRFGYLLLVAVSMLSAYGVAEVSRRSARWGGAFAVACLVLVNAEAFRGPVPFVRDHGVPPIYARLASLPDGPVAEMPFWQQALDVPRNADYMLGSTAHWKPLLNGYSGFTPASYRRRADVLWYFPFWPSSFDELERAGVRYVVVHWAEYGSSRGRALGIVAAHPSMRLLATDEDRYLYEIVP